MTLLPTKRFVASAELWQDNNIIRDKMESSLFYSASSSPFIIADWMRNRQGAHSLTTSPLAIAAIIQLMHNSCITQLMHLKYRAMSNPRHENALSRHVHVYGLAWPSSIPLDTMAMLSFDTTP